MTQTAHIVAGLAFGDEGKGQTTDFLTRHHNAGLVVRYNGGCQAAHNVVLSDGRHHTFAQFGSGTFVPGVRTHLSKFMLVSPGNMMNEEEHLWDIGIQDVWDRTTVDEKCLIITPYQRAANRLLEMYRGDNRHGSCGQGVGQTRGDHLLYGDKVLFAGDLKCKPKTLRKLKFLRLKSLVAVTDALGVEIPNNYDAQHCWKLLTDKESEQRIWKEYDRWPAKIVKSSYLGELIQESRKDVVFEGAQGVLLDETHGTPPFQTWTDTTYRNARTLLKDIRFNGDVRTYGVLRNYYTRHGNGPLPTEDGNLSIPEPHNETGDYQGSFRLGWFDSGLARRAMTIVGGCDVLVLNHLDTGNHPFTREEIEEMLGQKAGIIGFGPTQLHRGYVRERKLDMAMA